MTATPWRIALVSAGLMVCALVVWRVQAEISSGIESVQPQKAQVAKPTPGFAGVLQCARCHTQPLQGETPPDLCRCTEVTIWKKDKHRLAFTVLREDRAKQMGTLLGWNVEKAPGCVSCHGVLIRDANLLEDSKKLEFRIEDGVSCVVCHGPYKEWVSEHGLERLKWRKLTRAQKEANYGMTDLWHPAKRAKLCASCHIGSTAEGKVVTHAMYAAGHPPLPSLELATFSEEMPRHWEYLREKKAPVQKELGFAEEKARWEQTELVIVSGVVALRQSLDLLRTQAKQCQQAKEPSGQVLDLALFECASCHHELRYPGWRQARGYSGKPGRPRLSSWPTTLARLGIRQLGDEPAELDVGLAKLAASFDTRPFGDPERVAAEAETLVTWLDAILERLERGRFDRATVERMRSALTEFKDKEFPDYESARQRAWAFVILTEELDWKPGTTEAEQRRNYNQRLDAVSGQIGESLMLALPSGRDKQILTELAAGLKKQSNYDPRRFVEKFRALSPKPGR